MSIAIFVNGRLRERGDDATRTYTVYDAAGAVVSTRPYTAAENAQADADAAQASEAANQRTIEEAAAAALVDLQAIIDASNSTLNSGPAVAIKTLARVVRRIIRLVIRRFDGTT